MKHQIQIKKVLTICSFLFWAGTFGGGNVGGMISQDAKSLVISNFRRIEPDLRDDQFAWGNDSQLFYVRSHPSGRFIYLLDPASDKTYLITKGSSPAFFKFPGYDSIYFLRSTGYSMDKEVWLYCIYRKFGIQGEHKLATSDLMLEDDIYLNPDDSRLFAYRYFCCEAEGGFKQVRFAQLDGNGRPISRNGVLYSRSEGAMTLSISGWLDKDTLVCFLGEQPYRLKVSFQVTLPNYQSNPRDFNADHYPEDQSGLLIQGLEGINKVVLPRSNFSPDGNSYLIYSPDRNAILQKNFRGTELSVTMLPDSVKYLPIMHPVFSPDGRHIAFKGLVKTDDGEHRTIYLADIR